MSDETASGESTFWRTNENQISRVATSALSLTNLCPPLDGFALDAG